MKWKLKSSKKTPIDIFTGSRCGEYEKTYDGLGYYGINNQKRIKKELYPFCCKEYHESSPQNPKYYTKFAFLHEVLGYSECIDRCSPRIHFPFEPSFSNFIEKSNYMNVINHNDFLVALASNGMSLNRVLSVILILGLEDETLKLDLITLKDAHFLAKILLKIIYPSMHNHLSWIDTSEQHFLKKHYEHKYLLHLNIFLSKLKSESSVVSENPQPAAMISKKTLPAIYPLDSMSYHHLQNLVIASPTEENIQKYESAVKRKEYRDDLQNLDQFSPLELLEKLETHL
jgi:hypothetical protein